MEQVCLISVRRLSLNRKSSALRVPEHRSQCTLPLLTAGSEGWRNSSGRLKSFENLIKRITRPSTHPLHKERERGHMTSNSKHSRPWMMRLLTSNEINQLIISSLSDAGLKKKERFLQRMLYSVQK
ncbi:hypothetical protein CEXT_496471 [Caerostris extrusa]|uniref:Uncharacterized protein n=1 Tax=Caerostris extrusa TaxID=172846 RepID=A0AAV4XYZ2_CAEEX|nr:hypothetical protein CEXT_496471 [Caerostris extrusa]